MTQPGTTAQAISVAEAATITGLDPQRITRMIRSGELPHIQKLPGRTGAYLLGRDDVAELATRLATEAEERARDIRAALAEELAS